MKMIVTKTRVVLDRDSYAELLVYVRKHRSLVEQLRARLNDEHMLLLSALHELAVEKAKEPQYFSRRWLSAKRHEADPIPVRKKAKKQ